MKRRRNGCEKRKKRRENRGKKNRELSERGKRRNGHELHSLSGRRKRP